MTRIEKRLRVKRKYKREGINIPLFLERKEDLSVI